MVLIPPCNKFFTSSEPFRLEFEQVFGVGKSVDFFVPFLERNYFGMRREQLVWQSPRKLTESEMIRYYTDAEFNCYRFRLFRVTIIVVRRVVEQIVVL